MSASPRFRRTALAAATLVFALPATAGEFGPWGAARPVPELNSVAADGCPIEAPDGLSFYLASTRSGTAGGNDIFIARRARVDELWGVPVNAGAPVNSRYNDFCPTPVRGKWLFFVSERPGPETCNAGPGSGDIYMTRESPKYRWREPIHLGCAETGDGPNSNGAEFSPSLVETAEGTFLYFSSTRGGNMDIYASRLSPHGYFEPARLRVAGRVGGDAPRYRLAVVGAGESRSRDQHARGRDARVAFLGRDAALLRPRRRDPDGDAVEIAIARRGAAGPHHAGSPR